MKEFLNFAQSILFAPKGLFFSNSGFDVVFSSFFRESEAVLSFGFEWAGKSCWHFYCSWKHTV
jgi:hypothetical protein